MPQWSTAERRLSLVELWARYGNRCLQGHLNCPEPEHYIHRQPVVITSYKLVKVKCKDCNGNDMLDREGNPLYADTFHKVASVVSKDSISRLYELKESQVVKDWIAEDREARAYINRIVSRNLHRIPEKGALRGRFNAISRDIFFDSQPQFYLESIGVSGLTFKPFAKVRVASGSVRLHVNIDRPLKNVSKNRRRKAIRYNKCLPADVQDRIEQLCKLAVSKFLSK